MNSFSHGRGVLGALVAVSGIIALGCGGSGTGGDQAPRTDSYVYTTNRATNDISVFNYQFGPNKMNLVGRVKAGKKPQ